MAADVGTTVVGVFGNRELAREAAEELRRAGFAPEQMSLAFQEAPPAAPTTEAADTGDRASGPPTVGTGAGIGMLSGAALFGLAAGGPAGLLAGALVGGLLGAFIDLGIPETDARFYGEQVEAGRAVLTVRAGGRAAEAAEILLRCEAEEVRPPAG